MAIEREARKWRNLQFK